MAGILNWIKSKLSKGGGMKIEPNTTIENQEREKQI